MISKIKGLFNRPVVSTGQSKPSPDRDPGQNLYRAPDQNSDQNTDQNSPQPPESNEGAQPEIEFTEAPPKDSPLWTGFFVRIHEQAQDLLGRLPGRREQDPYQDSKKIQKKTGRRKGVLVDKKAS